jgi:hypothetical protein
MFLLTKNCIFYAENPFPIEIPWLPSVHKAGAPILAGSEVKSRMRLLN